MRETLEPISLGYLCEVKYQLSRNLFTRKFPDGDIEECRRQLLTPELGQKTFQRHVFDWQITPFEALLEILDNDFQGVFERQDLIVRGGEVVHRRLDTRHPHDFHPVDGVLDDAAIDRHYPAARSKFEHLAERFRRHLRAPGAYLYVFRQNRVYDDTAHLRRLLGAGHPDHRFKLLYVDDPAVGGIKQLMPADLDDDVFQTFAPLANDKPDGRSWEGGDAGWDSVLADFDIVAHDDAWLVRTLEESVARDASEPAATRTPGWRRVVARLFG